MEGCNGLLANNVPWLDSHQALPYVTRHLAFTFNNLTARGIPPKQLYLRVSRLNFG